MNIHFKKIWNKYIMSKKNGKSQKSCNKILTNKYALNNKIELLIINSFKAGANWDTIFSFVNDIWIILCPLKYLL